MARILTLLLLTWMTISFSGCVQHSNFIETNPIGKVYEDAITLREMTLPLPEGKWVVVGRGPSDSGNYLQLCLNKVVDDQIHAAIFIIRDSATTEYTGYKPIKAFKRDDILYSTSKKKMSGRGQDGWYINHIRLSFSGTKTRANKEALQYIKDNKLVLPGNFIMTSHVFTGTSNTSKFLRYSVYINPDLEGIRPTSEADWAASEWNILKINKHPEKLEYIEKTKEEGAAFHQKLKAAFGS